MGTAINRNGQQLNEIVPQVEGAGEQQLFTHCQTKEEFIKLKQVLTNYSHIANIKKSSSSSASFRELKANNYLPWMICEPNEKEGKKLLAEIMQGGNFGQYDTRDAALKKGGMMKHGLWKLKRVMRLVSSYPEEALWEPVFRVWHLVWRWING